MAEFFVTPVFGLLLSTRAMSAPRAGSLERLAGR